jgi:hypothetical protein
VSAFGRWPEDWHVLTPPSIPGRLRKPPKGLQRGDLLLRCPLDPTPRQRGIQTLQRLVYERSHASFTHVGIYVGTGYVVDATPEFGVAARPLRAFFEGGYVRARRLAGVKRTARSAVADVAIAWAKTKQPYAKGAAAAALLSAVAKPSQGSAWRRLLEEIVQRERTRLGRESRYSCAYCGNLVDDIAAAAANRSIINDETCFAALPAAFSANIAEYENVQLGW